MEDFEAYEGRVWEDAATRGMEGAAKVQAAYRPLVTKYADAGLAPVAAAGLLVEHMLIALDQFNVLSEALTLVADGLNLTVKVLDGDNDPITVGKGMCDQRAGIAVIADEMALLAPFAGLSEGFDQVATAQERAEAVSIRDGFMAEIDAVIQLAQNAAE